MWRNLGQIPPHREGHIGVHQGATSGGCHIGGATSEKIVVIKKCRLNLIFVSSRRYFPCTLRREDAGALLAATQVQRPFRRGKPFGSLRRRIRVGLDDTHITASSAGHTRDGRAGHTRGNG